MLTKSTRSFLVVTSLTLAGCGLGQETSKSSERSNNTNQNGSVHNGQKKAVSMSFALPDDVKRAHLVNGGAHLKKASAKSNRQTKPAPSADESSQTTDLAAPVEPLPAPEKCAVKIDEFGNESQYCDDSASSTEPGYPPVLPYDPRIQISCEEATPIPLGKPDRFGDHWLYQDTLWAAPLLRIALEEQHGDSISIGFTEFPFFCSGKALIQVVGLSAASSYRIGAELLDYNWNLQYIGSTENFTVTESAVTSVVLRMERYNGDGGGSVIVDVTFDDGAEPQSLPAPEIDSCGTADGTVDGTNIEEDSSDLNDVLK